CDFSFRSSTRLHSHIRKAHNMQPFACDTCGERFHRKVSLKEHMATHVEYYDDQVDADEMSNEVNEEAVETKDDYIDGFADLDDVDMSRELKEEEIKYKDEPLDAFADFEHNEPIADVYCPSTGTSSALGESTITPSGLESNMNRSEAATKRTTYRYCALCEEKTSSWVMTPIDPSEAKRFCDNLIDLSPEQREKI
ncbi:hypothetical protein PMAYCL1PPCAC_27838, partial [Pristionchus mayeri]